MATYMVANGRLSGNYGYGNAVAVVIFLISLVIAWSTSGSSCAATPPAP